MLPGEGGIVNIRAALLSQKSRQTSLTAIKEERFQMLSMA